MDDNARTGSARLTEISANRKNIVYVAIRPFAPTLEQYGESAPGQGMSDG